MYVSRTPWELLSGLRSLRSVTFLGDCKRLVCRNIDRILGSIPSKLERFCMSVNDWNLRKVRDGLVCQTGLKEVVMIVDSDGLTREVLAEQAQKVGEELEIPKVEFRKFMG
ncbi:hypothetical protein HDV00_012569 [Rhizophlyctis rosea]|nr:hypothetical protein HDV00_012569 [Rhizophlyctis rosea]